jgi:aminoglycoside phosphotransferase (APT) family kinase protein
MNLPQNTVEPPPRPAVRRLVHRIAERYFGKKAGRIYRDRKGRTNLVFHVSHGEEGYVIRIGFEPGKLAHFQKEAAAVTKAREAGVPAPRILEVGGDLGPYPYMILRRVRGESGLEAGDRLVLLRHMGAMAATLHGVVTVGFGGELKEYEPLTFQQPHWKAYLTQELDYESRLEILARYEMLTPPALKRLRQVLKEVSHWKAAPRLSHGDLRLKNVLVNDRTEIAALLDWEHCGSHPAPHWDLSVALHDLTIDEKQALLSGYGLSEREIREIAPALRAVNLINYAPQIERLVQCGGESSLEPLRTRLRGDLDLYAL